MDNCLLNSHELKRKTHKKKGLQKRWLYPKDLLDEMSQLLATLKMTMKLLHKLHTRPLHISCTLLQTLFTVLK